MCLLDPTKLLLPTKLLKDVLPLINHGFLSFSQCGNLYMEEWKNRALLSYPGHCHDTWVKIRSQDLRDFIHKIFSQIIRETKFMRNFFTASNKIAFNATFDTPHQVTDGAVYHEFVCHDLT